jgi:hypothetical protein|tara:strand:+ start:798 stop:1286 length:489 start_codon:yes stop_codon:yes gene_type:complete
MSKLLEIVYASGGDDVIIPTLEIKHSAFSPIRTCAGFEDQTVTLETGEAVTFNASGLDISLPARNASGQQDLSFAIENVTGIAQRAIDDALAQGGQVEVIYRTFLSSDLSTPAEPPLKMVLVAADFEGASVQVTASYQDLIGYAWPRDRYTVDFAPGLKYIG